MVSTDLDFMETIYSKGWVYTCELMSRRVWAGCERERRRGVVRGDTMPGWRLNAVEADIHWRRYHARQGHRGKVPYFTSVGGVNDSECTRQSWQPIYTGSCRRLHTPARDRSGDVPRGTSRGAARASWWKLSIWSNTCVIQRPAAAQCQPHRRLQLHHHRDTPPAPITLSITAPLPRCSSVTPRR